MRLKRGQIFSTYLGFEEITSIEHLDFNEENLYKPLFNLVIDGSHVYSVNDFFATGWPSENDFNYDTWSKR